MRDCICKSTRAFCSLLLTAITLLPACEKEPDPPPVVYLDHATIPGFYSGTFPCDDCPGIDIALWLRDDRRYLLRQGYRSHDNASAAGVYSIGRWSPESESDRLHLKSAGPTRVFLRESDDQLRFLTTASGEHTVVRSHQSGAFAEPMRMQGIVEFRGRAARFRECYSGLPAPVTTAGSYRSLRHRYRGAAGDGVPVLVEIVGTISWSESGEAAGITVRDILKLRPDAGC